MKRLSEVSWEDLRVGDMVISAIGNFGKIDKLYRLDRYAPHDQDGNMIEMLFISGRRSVQTHCMCLHVGYFEVVLVPK